MLKGYKIIDQYAPHFLTFTIVGWVDIFTRREMKEMVIDSFKYCQEKKGLIIHAYVIMSSHLHVIWSAQLNSTGLSSLVRDFKKYTSKQIIRFLNDPNESRRDWLKVVFKYHAKYNRRNSDFQIWTQDNKPKQIMHPKFARTKLNYIHMNPVVQSIVEKEEDYLYSSARNYLGIKNWPIEVVPLDFGAEEGLIFR